MKQPDFNKLVKQLISNNAIEHMAAQMIILSMEENAVNPLADVYYAGITDAEGVAILQTLARIGGYEALAVLRNVFDFEEQRPVLRNAAAWGLLHNKDKLSLEEYQEIARYFSEADENK